MTAAQKADVFKALSHPLRIQILSMLEYADDNDKLSPVQAHRETGEALGVVSYHFRVLDDLGMLKKAGRRPRRGAVEHFYRLNAFGRQALRMAQALA